MGSLNALVHMRTLNYILSSKCVCQPFIVSSYGYSVEGKNSFQIHACAGDGTRSLAWWISTLATALDYHFHDLYNMLEKVGITFDL